MRHLFVTLTMLAAGAVASAATTFPSVSRYDTLRVAAPFPMPEIYLYNFPHQDYNIREFGAVLQTGDLTDRECIATNRKAIADAMQACHEAGGGRVVIPEGDWLCGPIHFLSNCDLHLDEGARLVFSDDPQDYLPTVATTWEGYLCYNYSPLVYAYQCDNVAITGQGTLAPLMETWRGWFPRPDKHMQALRQLYNWCSFDEPVIHRQMPSIEESHLRPHLIQFNQCNNVLLQDFRIREAPFWTIHLFRCTGGVVRGLDVYAHGHNNDGIDIEMSRNFLVENCLFDQGDDAVVIKSGSNHDAWRIGQPTENVVVRNCIIRQGHVLLGVGSEISGGVRNIYMHDCYALGRVLNLFYLKTNRRRGGVLENIYMERVGAAEMERAMAIDTDVLYQWRHLVPTYKDTVTAIRNVYMRDVHCRKAKGIVQLNGDADLPIRHVRIENLHVDSVTTFIEQNVHVEDYQGLNITYDWFGDTGEQIYQFTNETSSPIH